MSTKEWKYDWWNHGINPITGPMSKPEIDDDTED